MPAFKIIEVRKVTVVLSGFIFILTTAWLFLGNGRPLETGMGDANRGFYTFESVPGIFLQDDPATDWRDFDHTKHNFGLIDRSYDIDAGTSSTQLPWARFDEHLRSILAAAPKGVTYKVLYLGRHGQGYHNVAESFYGTKDWDDYWSKLEGNGTVTWSDAHLTDVGKEQILDAHTFIKSQLSTAKMPAPEKYYVSPLYRCLQTADLTWSGLDLPPNQPFKPTIKELLREENGEHTCDRRSTKTFIHNKYPDWPFEPGFTEKDELWTADHRETHDEHDARTRIFFDELFKKDQSVYVSLTSHSGAIASKLRVLNHREFRLPTGGMIPVLVKATRRSA